METDKAAVCIVGLGLMGGSLALAWQDAGVPWRVTGVDRDQATLDGAQAAGAIAEGTADLASGIAAADVIVLATPVRTILRLLPEVGRHARPGALVLDLGSSKAAICAQMAVLPPDLQPVGGHPMCGTEHAGFGAASGHIYRGRPFVLCPLTRTAPEALAAAKQLAEAAGASPLVVEPTAHDAAVAAISHLPYAAATALVHVANGSGDPLVWSLAASGFRDTTRVAGSNVDVMLDALLTNQAAVIRMMDAFAAEVATLREALLAGDEIALRSYLEAAHARRSHWPGSA